MRRYITASQLFKRKLTDVEVANSLVLFYAQIAENEHIDKFFLQLRKKISFFICTFAPDLTQSIVGWFGKDLKRVWFSALTGTTIRMKRVKQLKESYTV